MDKLLLDEQNPYVCCSRCLHLKWYISKYWQQVVLWRKLSECWDKADQMMRSIKQTENEIRNILNVFHLVISFPAGCIVLLQHLKWQMFIRQYTTRLCISCLVHSNGKHTHISFAGKHVPSSAPSNISARLPLCLAELNPLRFVINVLSCVAQGGLGRAQRKPQYNLSNKKYDRNLRGFRKYATLEVLL